MSRKDKKSEEKKWEYPECLCFLCTYTAPSLYSQSLISTYSEDVEGEVRAGRQPEGYLPDKLLRDTVTSFIVDWAGVI